MSEQKNFELESIADPHYISMDPNIFQKKKEELFICDPDSFKSSKEVLMNIVKDYINRNFSEEIDKLEAMGGDNLIQKTISKIQEFHEDKKYQNKRTEKIKSICRLICKSLNSWFVRILFLFSLLSLILNLNVKRSLSLIDASAILLLLIINFIFELRQNYQKEKINELLIGQTQAKYTVTRNKNLVDVVADQILIGDIIHIYSGMCVPNDGYIINAENFFCDESALTGEDTIVQKENLNICLQKRDKIINDGQKEKSNNHQVPSPIILSGSIVKDGKADFIAITLDSQSSLGQIKMKLEEQENFSPLTNKIVVLTRRIGKFGIFSTIIIFVILMVRFIIERIKENDINSENINDLLTYFMIEITLVLSVIPEGISLSVTISLAYAVKAMLRDNILVRKLEDCETLANVNCICTGRSSLLTGNNNLIISHFWNEKNYSDPSSLIRDVASKDLRNLFLQLLIINNIAVLKPEPQGNQTDITLLRLAEQYLGEDYENFRKNCQILSKYPFSSGRKRVGTVIKLEGNKLRLLEKGNPEILLESCTSIHCLETNEIFSLDEERKQKTRETINYLSEKGERTTVMAYKDFDSSESLDEKDEKDVYKIEKEGLTLICVIGIKDRIRISVPEDILTCQKAKIKVIMITGDNKKSARSLAEDCNIIKPGDKNTVFEGHEIMNKIGQEFNDIYNKIDVLARATPEAKYAFIVGLKERGYVVAVAGAETSDAPAIKISDVGIAMGIQGTEITRNAAGILLLDDNYNTIINAILWGRNIHQSIRKSLQFHLTLMIVCTGIILIGSLALQQNIFTPIQMIWITLIIETLSCLGFANERPEIELLQKKPVIRNKSVISKKMLKHIIGQVLYQLTILILLIFAGENFLPEYSDSFDSEIERKGLNKSVKYNGDYVRSGRYDNGNNYKDLEYDFGPSRHFTIIFNTFIWMQIFNFLNCRKIRDEKNILKKISTNFQYVLIFIIMIFIQSLIVTHGAWLFHVYKWQNNDVGGAGLHIKQWLICIGFGSGSLIVSFLLKFIP